MVAVKRVFDVYTENDEAELMASLAKPEAPKGSLNREHD
jgi:hypothetical protein